MVCQQLAQNSDTGEWEARVAWVLFVCISSGGSGLEKVQVSIADFYDNGDVVMIMMTVSSPLI